MAGFFKVGLTAGPLDSIFLQLWLEDPKYNNVDILFVIICICYLSSSLLLLAGSTLKGFERLNITARSWACSFLCFDYVSKRIICIIFKCANTWRGSILGSFHCGPRCHIKIKQIHSCRHVWFLQINIMVLCPTETLYLKLSWSCRCVPKQMLTRVASHRNLWLWTPGPGNVVQ